MEALVKAKNISGRALCLTSGVVQPGDVGQATEAEMSTLWEYLERVVEPAPAAKKKEEK